MAGRSHPFSTPLPFLTETADQHTSRRASSTRSQSHESHSASASRPSTDSWTVTRGSLQTSVDHDSFSVVHRASGIYELVELLDDVEIQQSSPVRLETSRENSATPPPIPLYPEDRSNKHRNVRSPIQQSSNQGLRQTRPASSTERNGLHAVSRDGAFHYMSPQSGALIELVEGVKLDASLPTNGEDAMKMSIPEVEARDLRGVCAAQSPRDDDERGRRAARSPPPVMQNRSHNDPVRQTSPRPANKGETYHMVDRYSSYAGTRLRTQKTFVPSLAPSNQSHLSQQIRTGASSSSYSQRFKSSTAFPYTGSAVSGSTGNVGSSIHSNLPRSSTESQYHGENRHVDRSPHGSQHSSVSSRHDVEPAINQYMQAKIAQSAKAIEENLPWNRARRKVDGLNIMSSTQT